MNLDPTSAMATRALVAVSANWLPLSMSRALVTLKSSFSTAEVRVVYLQVGVNCSVVHVFLDDRHNNWHIH